MTVAQIAKVREKISDGDKEFEDLDDAMEEIPEEDFEEEVTLPKEEEEDED